MIRIALLLRTMIGIEMLTTSMTLPLVLAKFLLRHGFFHSVILLMMVSCEKTRPSLNESDDRCQATLHSVVNAIQIYRSDNKGMNGVDDGPKSLAEALQRVDAPGLAHCPNVSSGVRDESSYVYIDWWTPQVHRKQDIGDFPLVYDRKLSNHADRGVNVATVNGRVFWDERAAWLESFSRQHAEFRILVPD